MSLCHAGQLLQQDCRVETDDTSADSQRVRRRHSCASCLEKFRNRELQVPASRCRVLTAEVGHISASRTFFVRWSILGVLDVEVKAFQLVGSSHRLLVFRSVEDAVVAARCVPQLVSIDGETVGFRLCTNAKTFCPSRNFAASGASCLVHLDRRAGAGRSGTAGQSQALPSLSGAESGAGPVAGGSTKRSREASPSSEDSASTTAATSNHLGALLGSEPLDSAIDSFLGALISDPPLYDARYHDAHTREENRPWTFDDPAWNAGQLAPWSIDSSFSYERATRILNTLRNKFNRATRIRPKTLCTLGDVTARPSVFSPGQWACHDPKNKHGSIQCACRSRFNSTI